MYNIYVISVPCGAYFVLIRCTIPVPVPGTCGIYILYSSHYMRGFILVLGCLGEMISVRLLLFKSHYPPPYNTCADCACTSCQLLLIAPLLLPLLYRTVRRGAKLKWTGLTAGTGADTMQQSESVRGRVGFYCILYGTVCMYAP